MHFLDLLVDDELMLGADLCDINWRNIRDGVNELRTLRVLEEHLQHTEAPDRSDWLQWCRKKQRSVVQLMEREQQHEPHF